MNHEKEMKRLCARQINKHGVSKITGRLRNYYSGGAYVHNWLKFLEHESDHKPLAGVELMSEAIFLCLCMSVRSI
jgi:hypothetical protein